MREVIESQITRGYVDQCVEFDFLWWNREQFGAEV